MMEHTINQQKKKTKYEINQEKAKQTKKINIAIIIGFLLIISFLTTVISINMYKNGTIGSYDSKYKTTYSEFMNKKDEVYYVYFYQGTCENCENVKSKIVAYQRSEMQELNAPIYTLNIDEDIEQGRFLEYDENGKLQDIIVGKTKASEIKLASVPTLILIRKQSDVNTVITYVKGVDAIAKQLQVTLNYTIKEK